MTCFGNEQSLDQLRRSVLFGTGVNVSESSWACLASKQSQMASTPIDSLTAPEGTYRLLEEQKPPPPLTTLSSNQPFFPTRLSVVIVNFPQPKVSSPGFSALLGGTIKPKDASADKKDKKLGGNGVPYDDSLSSSDQGDEASDAADPETPSHLQPPTTSLFSSGADSGINKKKSTRKRKRNIRTTTSSFVTRLQTMENLNRHLASKSGEVTFLFHNSAKTFFWTEVGSKVKVFTHLHMCLRTPC